MHRFLALPRLWHGRVARTIIVDTAWPWRTSVRGTTTLGRRVSDKRPRAQCGCRSGRVLGDDDRKGEEETRRQGLGQGKTTRLGTTMTKARRWRSCGVRTELARRCL